MVFHQITAKINTISKKKKINLEIHVIITNRDFHKGHSCKVLRTSCSRPVLRQGEKEKWRRKGKSINNTRKRVQEAAKFYLSFGIGHNTNCVLN